MAATAVRLLPVREYQFLVRSGYSFEEGFGKRSMPDKRSRRHFSQLSEFERGLIIGMKLQAGQRAVLLVRGIVRSVLLEIVESSGHEKVPTCGKPGLERPGRPGGERIEGSCGKYLWIPQ
ncbi:hypothetical protein TNCV_2551951 [Trichonephila clavipes]|nr:hypothetical protein TNCV_2551951 [Trichonephila clavipes]